MKRRFILAVTALTLVLGGGLAVSAATEETVTVPDTEIITKSISVPKIKMVSRKGKGKTNISWKKVSKASGYEIQYDSDKNYGSPELVKIKKGSVTSKSISGLSKKKDTYIRMRAYRVVSGVKQYTKWSAQVKVILWKKSWKYAKNSKIHSDPVMLYYSGVSKKKRRNVVVAINAGHGCKGGSSKRTLCHPNGSRKVTGGSTAAGSKYATAINSGTSLRGCSEAAANLRVANKLKSKLLANGFDVLMIRQNANTQLDNIARTVMANKNADCHIAIHFDSTSSNKGAFYISVPNVRSYRNMQPVKSHWRQHNRLGSDLVKGLRSSGVKIFGGGSMGIDLTQTSYSTVPSVDIEVGDRATSTSDKNLNKIANGLLKGIKRYY